jgi:hypothetical protein
MGIWIGDRPSYTSWPYYYLPIPCIMTSLTSTKEIGFAAETPAHPARNATDNGGRTTFSQRIAWRNGNNNTVVTPTAMEATTPVTPAASEAITNRTSGRTDLHDSDQTDYDNPYESILQDAAKWKRQLESARDEIYFLQVQNAMHLDYLTMAGAEE